MDHTGRTDIRLIVEDEQSLYTTFSPEDEFEQSVKSYIKSKLIGKEDKKNISLTVVSRKPMDEERFRSAVSNWTREETRMYKKEEKETLRTLIGLLIFGSVIIVMSIALETHHSVVKYSLMPIMGSLALTEAARIIIINMPTIRIGKWLVGQMENHKVVSFEYNDKNSGEAAAGKSPEDLSE